MVFVCFEVWFLSFASRSAVSLLRIPTCEGTHWKATVSPSLLRSSCCSAMAIAVISPSKLVLLKLLKNKIISVHALKFFYELWFYSKEWKDPQQSNTQTDFHPLIMSVYKHMCFWTSSSFAMHSHHVLETCKNWDSHSSIAMDTKSSGMLSTNTHSDKYQCATPLFKFVRH